MINKTSAFADEHDTYDGIVSCLIFANDFLLVTCETARCYCMRDQLIFMFVILDLTRQRIADHKVLMILYIRVEEILI
jgi:hypothetical protein